MSRGTYKTGTQQVFLQNKDKFGKFPIDNLLNDTYFVYEATNLGVGAGEEIEDSEASFSNFLTNLRTRGETSIRINLQKTEYLRPAGRLKVINTGGSGNAQYAGTSEDATFANNETLTFISKEDILRLGGLDKLLFLSKIELTKTQCKEADKRNVGFNALEKISLNTTLSDGKTLAYNEDTNKWNIIFDTSTVEEIGEPTIEKEVVLGTDFPRSVLVDGDNVFIVQSGGIVASEPDAPWFPDASRKIIVSHYIYDEEDSTFQLVTHINDVSVEEVPSNESYQYDKIELKKLDNNEYFLWFKNVIWKFNLLNDFELQILDNFYIKDETLGFGGEKYDNGYVFSNFFTTINNQKTIFNSQISTSEINKKVVVENFYFLDADYDEINNITENLIIEQSSLYKLNSSNNNKELSKEETIEVPFYLFENEGVDTIVNVYSAEEKYSINYERKFLGKESILFICLNENKSCFYDEKRISKPDIIYKIRRFGREIRITTEIIIDDEQEFVPIPCNVSGYGCNGSSTTKTSTEIYYLENTLISVELDNYEAITKDFIYLKEDFTFDKDLNSETEIFNINGSFTFLSNLYFFGTENIYKFSQNDGSLLKIKTFARIGEDLELVQNFLNYSLLDNGNIYFSSVPLKKEDFTLDLSNELTTLNNFSLGIDLEETITNTQTYFKSTEIDYQVWLDSSRRKVNINNNGYLYSPIITEDSNGILEDETFTQRQDLTIDDRTEKEACIDEGKVQNQPIFMISNKNEAPQMDNKASYFDNSALRVDMPKYKNIDDRFIELEFTLNLPNQPINCRYIRVTYETFVQLNGQEFIGPNDTLITFDFNREFEDNELWFPNVAHPIVTGATIYHEYHQISTQRYSDELYIALLTEKSLGPNEVTKDTISILNPSFSATMMEDINYARVNNNGFLFGFSDEFLFSYFGTTVGSTGINSGSNNGGGSYNAEKGYGLDLNDLTWIRYGAVDVVFSDRRWNFTDALKQQDFAIADNVFPNRADIYYSKTRPNENLTLEKRLNIMQGLVRSSINWNGTLFDQKYINNNGGTLQTIDKNIDLRNWDRNNQNDKSYGFITPASVEKIHEAMIAIGNDALNEIQFKSVKVTNEPIIPQLMDVPNPVGMFSRLPQNVFTDPAYCQSIGLNTDNQLEWDLFSEQQINRIRSNVFGGGSIQYEFFDSNGNYAKDKDGKEVPPLKVQSPNVSKTPTDSFLEEILGV